MSEEQATDGQQIANAIPASVNTSEQSTETPPQSTENTQPNGAYQPPVDLSGLPDDIRNPIEARLAHLSRLQRKSENKYEARLSERDRLLSEQSKIIEELQTGVGAVVDHLHDKSLNDAEAQIMSRLEQAHEAGDTKAFLAAQRDLARLEAKKISLEEKKSAPKQQKQTNQPASRSAGEFANQGVTDGDIDSEDGRVIGTWQEEKDDSGNLLRPWAHSRTPDNPTNDPYYRRALIEAAAVFDEASPFANKPVSEKLAEVDRRMGVSKPAGSQTVMGGSLTTQRKNGKVSLTPNQERIAVRTKFGGSKAKSDSDHIEAYRKQVETYRAKKGAR